MPSSPVNTFTGDYLQPAFKPELAFELPVKLVDGTYARGQVLGEVTATPGTFKAYASGNSDGSEVPRCLLRRACVVSSGLIYYGAQASSEYGLTDTSAPAYFSGTFFSQDLNGLDANAVTKLGRQAQGDATTGTINLI